MQLSNLFLNKLVVSSAKWLVLILAFWGVMSLQKRQIDYSQTSHYNLYNQRQEPLEEQKISLWKTIPSLGFSNIIADWVYLQFIQYFGDSQSREKYGYALSPNYFELIVERDPRFVNAILNLDTATAVFDGNPQKSTELIAKSLSSFTSDFKSPSIPSYYLWRSKGINQLLFLGDAQGAKKSYQNAIEWAKKYPQEQTQNFILNLEQTIHFLAKNPNSRAAQIGSWASILSSSSDTRTTRRVMKKIEELGGKIEVREDGQLKIYVPPDID